MRGFWDLCCGCSDGKSSGPVLWGYGIGYLSRDFFWDTWVGGVSWVGLLLALFWSVLAVACVTKFAPCICVERIPINMFVLLFVLI